MKHLKCSKDGCKRMCWRCILFTVGFPLEHAIWERLPVFKAIPPLLGLH